MVLCRGIWRVIGAYGVYRGVCRCIGVYGVD